MDNVFFYLKADYKTDEKKVRFSEICKVFHSAKGYLNMDETLNFDGNTRVISALVISQILTKKFPNANIQNMGPAETVLNRRPKTNLSNLLKTIGLCIVLFFGGAMGIMTFSQDVSMGDMLKNLHMFYTGEVADRAPVIAIPFAIGVGAGFLTILQIFKKKSSPPGLIDITLDEFETQIDDYNIKRQE